MMKPAKCRSADGQLTLQDMARSLGLESEFERSHRKGAKVEVPVPVEDIDLSLFDAEPEVPTLDKGIVCLADLVATSVKWLWPSRVALGKISVFAGDPGVGKSTLTLDMATRVSRGFAWPDSPEQANTVGSVMLVCAEDGMTDTIIPRLNAMGADLNKVRSVDGVSNPDGSTSPFNLKTDLSWLESNLKLLPDVRVVVIDPISCFLGNTDDNKNGAVRALLAPLAAMAQRLDIAVVLVSHLNKASGAKAAYRLMGSVAFGAAARAVWMIAEDPKEKGRVLMLESKNNLAKRTLALAYRIEDGKLVWEEGTIDMTADELLREDDKADREPGKAKLAVEFLRELLAEGALPATQVAERAAEIGISKRTLDRARGLIGIVPSKVAKEDGPGFHWVISLPPTKEDADQE